MSQTGNPSASVIYVTCPDRATAVTIARELVAQRLIACANIWDGVVSVYRWQGQVEQGNETVLWIKTRSELVGAVMERVRALHPYECPCVVSWPIGSGSAAFLGWIDEETERKDEGCGM